MTGSGLHMPGSNACNGIMYFVPLCFIQIQAELDISPSLTADVPYMLRFLSHFCNGLGLYINEKKHGATQTARTHTAHLGFVYQSMGRKHDSKTCV